jgi:hypothetical protein
MMRRRCENFWAPENQPLSFYTPFRLEEMLGVGCWVLGVGCWVLGVGCWVLGVVWGIPPWLFVECWVLEVGVGRSIV